MEKVQSSCKKGLVALTPSVVVVEVEVVLLLVPSGVGQ